MYGLKYIYNGAKFLAIELTRRLALLAINNLGLVCSIEDRAMLKWWYNLATLPEDRYLEQLFNQEWNIKPCRGRQRKVG